MMTDCLRVQTTCVLTVRLTWSATFGHSHPKHTFTCVEDEAMALTAARCAGAVAPAGIRLVRAETSETGGRSGPWMTLDLADGWISGPCM